MSAEDKQRARERFDRGVELFKQGAWAPALAEFLESRRLYKTRQATGNAAICLKELRRYDEAHDMYVELLRDFGDKLSPEAKQKALQDVEETRRLIATIEVEGSEPGAAIVVDQQDRGDYPLLLPLRVVAGNHIVRVYKEGFEPFEKSLDVAGGTTAHVTARLRKLTVAGTLQVVEAQGREVSVFVDGVKVGKTPFKAPLTPGRHVVFVRGEGDLGTTPIAVTVRLNETAAVRLEAEPLTALLRIEPTPFDALVSLDSVELGRGLWEGHVKPGKHVIEAAAEGFLPERREVTIGKGKREVVLLPLSRDPKSPFWRRPPPPPHFVADMAAGLPLYPSLGGDAGEGCKAGCSSPAGFGASLVVRAGYELSSGLSFGAAGGYLSTMQVISGRGVSVTPFGRSPEPGVVNDSLRLSGALFGVWAGYSYGETWILRLRASAGGLFGAASDTRTGSFRRSGAAEDENPFTVGPYEQGREARYFFIAPEAAVGLSLRRQLEITAGVEVNVLIAAQAPAWKEQPLPAGRDGYASFPEGAITGPVVAMFIPRVGVRYSFY